MSEKLKALLVRFNPHSKVFIVAVFSVFFLILILITVQFRVGQSRQNNTAQTTPTSPPRVLTPGKDYVEGQINVKFADGMTDQKINQVLVPYNARIKSAITGINVKVVEVPVGQEEAITKKLIEEGIVKYAELDEIMRVQYTPNDTEFSKQWAILNTGQAIKNQPGTVDADMDLDQAWDVTKGNSVKIAVIDTGIDLNHPDIGSKVVLQKSFTTSTTQDIFGHGTFVAAIATANTNNTQGMAGACPDCQLIVVKASDDQGQFFNSVAASSITWAADNGAQVINMSFGAYGFSATTQDAVNYAWNKGVVLVGAAGNDNSNGMFYPSAYQNVVAVGATDNKDQKWSLSNYGSWVHVSAPGKDIFSAFPTFTYRIREIKGTALNYDFESGTSAASPFVSGVVALMRSAQPNATNQQIVDKLYASSDKIVGTGTYWQKGRVNAAAAVGASSSATPTLTPGPTASPGATITPTSPPPTSGLTPTAPAPTFVCGGSSDSICNPTDRPGSNPTPTRNPNPTITQGPGMTGTPGITPTVTPTPVDDCLDVRSTPERIREWVQGFFKKINDYIQRVMGNPQDPNRPPPPRPCIIR